MPLTVTSNDSLVTIALSGSIDAKDSVDFERQVLNHLAEYPQRFVVDFESVTLITGAGIRVLMFLAQRLKAYEGALALCGLSDQVRSVFDSTGLSRQFDIASSKHDALAQLFAIPVPGPDDVRRTSKLCRLVGRLFADLGEEPGNRLTTEARSEETSNLTERALALLTSADDAHAEDADASGHGNPDV